MGSDQFLKKVYTKPTILLNEIFDLMVILLKNEPNRWKKKENCETN